jgi:phosphatidylinositol kinase/protein kinase (PI-3  family)
LSARGLGKLPLDTTHTSRQPRTHPPLPTPKVSQELIRIAILWHEEWHEALEEASRLYFGESNVEVRGLTEGFDHV